MSAAGRDLEDADRAAFTRLNDTWVAKFGFPFIIAVRYNTKTTIMDAIRRRIANDRDTEFTKARRQV